MAEWHLGPTAVERLVPILGDIGTAEGAAQIHSQVRELTDELFAIETRLYPHYLAAEALLPLIATGGSYTTINGPAGFISPPPPGIGAIAVAAAAQNKLVSAIAAETAGQPRVNDVVMKAFLGPGGTRPGSPLTGEQVADYVVALAANGTDVHNGTIHLHDPHQVDDALSGTFA